MSRSPIVIDGRTWGARVRERRELLGLSQAQLAERSGLEQQTISKIERDQICPRDTTKVILSDALRARVTDVFPWAKAT